MSRYLVTGCAGFLGSHLSDALLAGGNEVVGIDAFTACYARTAKERNLAAARSSPAFELHEADLAEVELEPLLEGVDGVFHLAARRGAGAAQDPPATRRLLEAAAVARVRVVLFSSWSVYGEAAVLPTPEHAACAPAAEQGAARAACEQLAGHLLQTRDLDVVVLRPFTVYGLRQPPDMALARIAAALDGGAPFPLAGSEDATRDHVHVADVVDAALAAFHRSPRGMTLNVGTGEETSLAALLERAGELAGRPVPVTRVPAQAHAVSRACADVRRLRTGVGWAPAIQLAEGLSDQLGPDGCGASGPAHSPATVGRSRLPFVSIVVPAYNCGAFLRASLDSIVAQTYPNREIIVMDDASTDDTEEVAASYGRQISYHRQSRNQGQFANVNDGVAIARGELIGIYHGDDVYHPDIVAREVEWLQRRPELGAVFCKDVFIDAGGRPFGALELPGELAGGRTLDYETVVRALLLYKNRFLRCPSSMVRAAAYRQVGGYEPDFRIAADLEMWVRLVRRFPVAVIDEHLFQYRSGHGSASDTYFSQPRAEREGYFDILDRELAHGARDLADQRTLAAYAAHRAEEHLRLAVTNYVLGRTGMARSELRRVSPRDILGGPETQRARLLAIAAVMHGLARAPRSTVAAGLLSRHVFVSRTTRDRAAVGVAG